MVFHYQFFLQNKRTNNVVRFITELSWHYECSRHARTFHAEKGCSFREIAVPAESSTARFCVSLTHSRTLETHQMTTESCEGFASSKKLKSSSVTSYASLYRGTRPDDFAQPTTAVSLVKKILCDNLQSSHMYLHAEVFL